MHVGYVIECRRGALNATPIQEVLCRGLPRRPQRPARQISSAFPNARCLRIYLIDVASTLVEPCEEEVATIR